MVTIHKFPLHPETRNVVKMPSSFEVVGVEVQWHHDQNSMPVLYALVDPDAHPTDVEFGVFATGQEIPAEVYGRDAYLGLLRVPVVGKNVTWLYFHVFGPRAGGSFRFTSPRLL